MKKIIMFFVLVMFLISVNGLVLAQDTDLLANVKANNNYKIGILLKTLANPFWAEMEEGIKAEAEKQGVQVDIYAVSSEGDSNEQLRLFENLLNRNYDGIAFAPITPGNLVNVIAKANDRGIPLVNLDERVPNDLLRKSGGYIYSFVTTNNVKVGMQAAEFVKSSLSGGKIAIIEGKAGNASGEDRKEGFTKAISKNKNFQIVASQPADWDRTKAIDVTTNILTRYPDVKAIYAANDTMALGVVRAVEDQNKSGDILIVGTDGIPEAIKYVKEGRLDATIKQDPYNIGVTGLRLLIQALNIPQQLEVPSLLVK
ncbi:D-allose transporter substrate-binding protein [Halanaerobium salsuginis]|jgi:D-allose transport system substrate-binding protein|uniref:Allose-binding protein n=1 Tax=Halanaerobium salsuginis TaxID=29563 RepID=A0A1I4I4F9_9FIRM|nr:D-allose transporter substrate-binding protein [Halanaerobium salsuginis]SFL48711.1 allose-binding protein [Halanaerobium salsuginis]